MKRIAAAMIAVLALSACGSNHQAPDYTTKQVREARQFCAVWHNQAKYKQCVDLYLEDTFGKVVKR